MGMDLAKACDRDLKRFDDLTTRFETVGLVLGFVNFFLAVWVRAPGLQMDPGSGIGLTVAGFNVGYAIVYGPVVALFSMLFSVSLLERRDAVREQILRLGAQAPEALSDGDRVAIGSPVGSNASLRKADIAWRAIWYVFLPPAAAAMSMLRYFDFVPDEAAKEWSVWGRVRYLLLETRGWETRPILPDHALEAGKDSMARLPYIYPPAGSWIEIGLVLATAFMATRVWRLYVFPEAVAPVDASA
jgi:hypothetical protein